MCGGEASARRALEVVDGLGDLPDVVGIDGELVRRFVDVSILTLERITNASMDRLGRDLAERPGLGIGFFAGHVTSFLRIRETKR